MADKGIDLRVEATGVERHRCRADTVRSDAVKPEVILLDIGMRGLAGYETCQRIRRVLGNRVLLVALTGFGEQDKEKATRAGFGAHLTKPADGAALARILAYRE
jgi:CheY-like chemotaxis protein